MQKQLFTKQSCLFFVVFAMVCSLTQTIEAAASKDMQGNPVTSQESGPQTIMVDWSRLDEIHAEVSFYYSQQGLLKGRPFTIEDPVSKKTFSLKFRPPDLGEFRMSQFL